MRAWHQFTFYHRTSKIYDSYMYYQTFSHTIEGVIHYIFKGHYKNHSIQKGITEMGLNTRQELAPSPVLPAVLQVS